jgi:hypothetical protein
VIGILAGLETAGQFVETHRCGLIPNDLNRNRRRQAVKRILALGLLGVLAGSMSFAQGPASGQELLKVERAWADALVKRDVSVVEQIYADEYVDIDPDGIVTNKAQDLANLKSGALKLTAQTLADMKVNVYGEVGVGRSGRWRCVSTQSTRVAKK